MNNANQMVISWLGDANFLPYTLNNGTVLFTVCFDVIGEMGDQASFVLGQSPTDVQSSFVLYDGQTTELLACNPEPEKMLITVGCPKDFVVKDTIHSNIVVNNALNIIGSNVVRSRAHAIYQGALCIELQDSFTVERGGVFEAAIGACDNVSLVNNN